MNTLHKKDWNTSEANGEEHSVCLCWYGLENVLKRKHLLMGINVINLKRAEYKNTPKRENMML